MTTKRSPLVRLDRLGDGQLAILREEVNDWLVAKSDDLPAEIDGVEGVKREVEEVAALGRLVSGLRREEIRIPDPVAREMIARTTGENRHLDEVKKEYDRALGQHKAWLALLAKFDEAPDGGGAAAEPEEEEVDGTEESGSSAGSGGPGASASKWIELGGRLTDDQLRIVRMEVTGYLAGKAGDLHLLRNEADPERVLDEIAALARLAFWLERGEVEVPDPIVQEMAERLAKASDDLNEYERLRERYERGTAEHGALAAFAAVFSEDPPGGSPVSPR